ncbi:unnamed protein product, partial [Callosobruchus maculatus]
MVQKRISSMSPERDQPSDEDKQQPESVTSSQAVIPPQTIPLTENRESVDRSPLQSTIPEEVTYSPEKDQPNDED